MFYDYPRVDAVGSLDASGANSVVFAAGAPIYVESFTFVTTIAQTVADATITVAVRDIDNGNSVTIGTFKLALAGSVLDKVIVAPVAERGTGPTTLADGTIGYEGGPGFIKLQPNQEIVLTSDGGGDAGTYQVYVKYYSSGNEPDVVTEVAFVPA